jgi:hypothetical protein
MAFLVFGLPAVLFTVIGRAAAPARPTSVLGQLGRLGEDLARGLRVCAMTAPQHLGSAASRAGR